MVGCGFSVVWARMGRNAARPSSELGADPGKEENMTALMMKLVADDAGQDLAEYGIALAVIGTIAAAAAIVIAKDVGTLWSKAQNVIDSAAS